MQVRHNTAAITFWRHCNPESIVTTTSAGSNTNSYNTTGSQLPLCVMREMAAVSNTLDTKKDCNDAGNVENGPTTSSNKGDRNDKKDNNGLEKEVMIRLVKLLNINTVVESEVV